MKYKIEWVEVVKTGIGEKGPWKKSKMSLTDETGKKEENVSTFQDVMAGQELEGVISYNEQYKSKEFKSTPKQPTNAIYNKSAQIEKVMDKKNESISKFADRKEEAIALAGAQRDAVLIVATLINARNFAGDITTDVKEEITKWRNWFLSTDFKQLPPF